MKLSWINIDPEKTGISLIFYTKLVSYEGKVVHVDELELRGVLEKFVNPEHYTIPEVFEDHKSNIEKIAVLMFFPSMRSIERLSKVIGVEIIGENEKAQFTLHIPISKDLVFLDSVKELMSEMETETTVFKGNDVKAHSFKMVYKDLIFKQVTNKAELIKWICFAEEEKENYEDTSSP